MKKTITYLDDAMEKLGLENDNQIATWLGVTRASVCHWRKGKSILDDYSCLKIADVLGIDPMEIITAANIEREKKEQKRKVWEEFSRRRGWAAVLFIFVISNSYEIAREYFTCSENIHYAKLLRRRRRAFALA